MKDRVPLYPGRVKLTPVSGQANTYDMVRADSPTQAGTPLNKTSLLKDATAALFGLGTEAVPDDIFAYLGKYAECWWERRAVIPASYITEPPPDPSSSSYWIFVGRNDSIEWSDSLMISPDGTVSLINPGTGTGESLRSGDWAGKFVKAPWRTGSTSASPSTKIIKFTAPYSAPSINDNKCTFNGTKYLNVTGVSEAIADEFDYVMSPDSEAYPVNGRQGNYYYTKIGVPLDRSVASAQLETGSYTGTGTYGASNPNSLTFGFAPKLVIVSTKSSLYPYQSAGSWAWSFIYSYGATTTYVTSSMVYFALEGKTLKWYSGSENPQLNGSGTVYHYLAIG